MYGTLVCHQASSECFLAAAGGLEVRVRLTKVLPQHLREEKIRKRPRAVDGVTLACTSTQTAATRRRSPPVQPLLLQAPLLQAQTDAKSSRSTNRECCSLYSAAKHLEHLRTPWAVPSVYRPSSRPTCSRFGWIGPVALLVLWPTCPKSIAYGIVECR